MPTGIQSFDVVPSTRRAPQVTVQPASSAAGSTAVVGVLVDSDADFPALLGLEADRLNSYDFSGRSGQTTVLTSPQGPFLVAVGLGHRDRLTHSTLRDAVAAFSRSVPHQARLAVQLPPSLEMGVDSAVTAVVEGVVLARYRFSMKSHDDPSSRPVDELVLYVQDDDVATAQAALPHALAVVAATELGRDLANCPGGQLTASKMAEVAEELARDHGFAVEIFDRAALTEMGCGGLLGVNLGSVEEPRMIKLNYEPDTSAAARVALVGKGIMYDSGGISLKPSDGVHATMKNDMSGAGAVLAAVSALQALDCPLAVTAYLMCTDNMPSGSALKMGDVLTVRGGTTVEVVNTDAEGRLVMSDALVLATEESPDAIVDIATLTGACLRALGPDIAGVMGTSQELVEQVRAAGERTDEPVWPFPLTPRYRASLDSDIADLNNLGAPHAGQIVAGLFLAEFVADVPWAHIDIAGTAQADSPNGWRCKGATGFGTRLLLDLLMNFRTVSADASRS
jgi:leucyl aminopeptidase